MAEVQGNRKQFYNINQSTDSSRKSENWQPNSAKYIQRSTGIQARCNGDLTDI